MEETATTPKFDEDVCKDRDLAGDSSSINKKKKDIRQSQQHNKQEDSPRRSQHQKRQNPFDKRMTPNFEIYWSKEDVQQGLKRGELVKGTIRVNQKNYEEAFVDDPAGGPDYFIVGVHNRNRALHEDTVVIKILPRDKWLKEQSSYLSKKNSTTIDPLPNAASETAEDCAVINSASTTTSCSLKLNEAMTVTKDFTNLSVGEKNSQDITDASAIPTLVDELFKTIPRKSYTCTRNLTGGVNLDYRRTAKVVYIMNKVHSRAFAGHLRAFSKEKGIALLSPRDNKVPRVLVPLKDCPKDYPQSPKKYDSCLFVCRIQDWPEYSTFPTGILLRSLGEAGEIEGESEAILLENDVNFADFSKDIIDSLPQLPWSIPKEEEQKRKDFRKDCVFTIDPETARDLDDALHVKQLKEGVYEVGVHIADVGYFIKPGSALDCEASQRATSVYLVQKVVPMLPEVLCANLCSLNPNEDKLTVSVVWHLNLKGELISQWIGRSIICSCAKLSYHHAQLMIDRKWQDNKDILPHISGGHNTSEVAESVFTLNKLACVLRAQRQSKGSLRLNQPKLRFAINPSTGLPCGCEVYPILKSNRMIEEFMLLANMAVARVISEAYPTSAMLRRHPKPKERAAAILVSRCASLGISLNVTCASDLQESLNKYKGLTDDPDSTQLEKMILTSLCSRIMNLACYFASYGSEETSHHYALNVPLYTHFTSPIRRYADIIVHRQLVFALGEGPSYCSSSDEIGHLADICNQKKKAAKIAGDLSSDLFFAVFVKECGPICGKGMVMQVLDKSFDVLVKDLGITKRVYCERLPLKHYFYEEKGEMKVPNLTLVWSDSKLSGTKQVITIFTPVEVTLLAGSKSLQYEAKATNQLEDKCKKKLQKLKESRDEVPTRVMRMATKRWYYDHTHTSAFKAKINPVCLQTV